jgi:tetratricopeptide (TPR) repeat protein
LTKDQHATVFPTANEDKEGLRLEAYPNKIDGYLSELKVRSRAAISAFSSLESSESQVSFRLCVQKFLNECKGISDVLWNSNNKKLRKHIRAVLSISGDSPFSPVAFSRLKTVIRGIEKTGETEKTGRKDKKLNDKRIESTQAENAGHREPGFKELVAFSYDPSTKMLTFDGKNYELLPLFLAARDLYASLPFFKELQECTEMLETNPEDVTARFQKSVLLYKARRFEAALQLTAQVLKAAPDDYKVWYNRGVILGEMGRLEAALEAYNRAIELEPTFEISWDNKGVVLARLGRFEEALETYEEVLLRAPKYAEAWAGKASILSALGRKEEALEVYNQAIKIRPEFLEALTCTGSLLSILGRFEEALAAYDRALQLAPKEPALWAGRSFVLLELHRYEEALQSCNRALELKPGFVPALEIKLRIISEISRQARSSE